MLIWILHWYRTDRPRTSQILHCTAALSQTQTHFQISLFCPSIKIYRFLLEDTAFHENLHRLVDESIRDSIRLGFLLAFRVMRNLYFIRKKQRSKFLIWKLLVVIFLSLLSLSEFYLKIIKLNYSTRFDSRTIIAFNLEGLRLIRTFLILKAFWAYHFKKYFLSYFDRRNIEIFRGIFDDFVVRNSGTPLYYEIYKKKQNFNKFSISLANPSKKPIYRRWNNTQMWSGIVRGWFICPSWWWILYLRLLAVFATDKCTLL